MLAICLAICLLAPVPTASMAITAPTPMMIPSMVRADRILLTLKARRAIREVQGRSIMGALHYLHEAAGFTGPSLVTRPSVNRMALLL